VYIYLRKFWFLVLVFASFQCYGGNGTPLDPIALYLTWQHSPATTMSVQWITTDEVKSNTLEFHAEGDSFWQSAEGSYSPMPGLHHYLIHRLELTGLRPFTDYKFRTGEDGKIYTFRTMPTDPTIPIRFVVGGDIYHDGIDTVIATNRQAALTSPMFALVGGDLAYAADRYAFLPIEWPSWMDWMLSGVEFGNKQKMRWIEWLEAWKETMVTPEGRLIPMVPVIGNHDVNGGFDKTPQDALIFNALFPFPGTLGYNHLDFNDNLSIVILNSGHTAPIGGQQTRWLFETLRNRQNTPHLFAIYHVPAYPSVRKFSNKMSTSIRRLWVPLFERFGVAAAFEHHDHAYKRTHPLRGNKVDPTGVLYLGDGAWGPEKTRTPRSPDDVWYLAKTASRRHFILVTLQGNKRTFAAIDPRGEEFDQVSSVSAINIDIPIK